MKGGRRQRFEAWLVAHSVLGFFALVATWMLVAAVFTVALRRPFELHAVVPYAVAWPALVIWRVRRVAKAGSRSRHPARECPRDLASAWSETWKLVVVHSVGGSLLLALVWTTGLGLAVQETLTLAAILLLPVFLCAVIFDVGGALAGDHRT